MGCCIPGGEISVGMRLPGASNEVLLASRVVANDLRQTDLSVPAVHCGACIQTVEGALTRLPGVEHARVNLSTRRVTVRWRGEAPPPLLATLRAAGYDAHLDDGAAMPRDTVLRGLVRALAVAGFAASNIMMLSVAVWSGADPASRDLFHWLSAAIGLPALVYSGRVFFASAWNALRHGHTNMDVPISIGVGLAFAMSLYETFDHGEHAYFDAATALLFFLLIGRTLDHLMRERARSAVSGLQRLAARGALVREADGGHRYVAVDEIVPGITILLAAGERVPVDARVVDGRSEFDVSLVSGESLPLPVGVGDRLQAGMLNLTAPLTIVAVAAARESFLVEMTRMMETAEAGRSRYRCITDRAARWYAPVVHLTALLAFAGWMVAAGDIHRALTVAIAVLIITCPCALGLAAPIVQVVAARRLFEHGIMLKDGGALERLAEADHVVFDKTGTLTRGTPRLANSGLVDRKALAIARQMALRSRHPYSLALAAVERDADLEVALGEVSEHPGAGLEARSGDATYRLGRPDWALPASAAPSALAYGVVLSENRCFKGGFSFADETRPDARAAIAALRALGIAAEIVSGDRAAAVAHLAVSVDLPYIAQASPGDKLARLAQLAGVGRKALMVGDGLNDAPALAAAFVSMAPVAAADVGRNAADLVFLRDSLNAVPRAIGIARAAAGRVRQNLAFAVGYNVIAVPVAIFGYVTPLVAAIAMSLSSIIVVANALRHGPRADAIPAAAAVGPGAVEPALASP